MSTLATTSQVGGATFETSYVIVISKCFSKVKKKRERWERNKRFFFYLSNETLGWKAWFLSSSSTSCRGRELCNLGSRLAFLIWPQSPPVCMRCWTNYWRVLLEWWAADISLNWILTRTGIWLPLHWIPFFLLPVNMTAQDKVTRRSRGKMWHRAEGYLKPASWDRSLPLQGRKEMGPPHNFMDQSSLLQMQREES